MAGLSYGSDNARASRQEDDDSTTMLAPMESASPESNQYLPYRPSIHSKSHSDDTTSQRTSASLDSPFQPQELVSPVDHRVSSPTPVMGFSIFDNSANAERAYQEQVPWANSTQFKSVPSYESKPEKVQTASWPEESEPPPSRKYIRHPRHMLEPWTTGVWLRFPRWGFGALLTVTLLTGGSAGIAIASHGTTMDHWKIGNDNAQPQVYLSIFEMLMNFLILSALVDGVVIRFWRQLLHGTTLDSVHDTYESAHIWSAARRLTQFKFNMVAVACVLTSLSFARGPLLQRAITLTEKDQENVAGVYHASPLFVTLGVAVSLIGVFAIIPLYYGFWELGREVSLNPLEIARAFGAPMMEGLDGNTTPGMITVEKGGMSVKYGALDRYGKQKKLRVEESGSATVRTPWKGEIFG